MGRELNHYDYMDAAMAPIEAQRDDALEELTRAEKRVAELEREVRLMRQQYFRRLEERDALQAEKADLLTALEQTLATLDAVCEMQGFDKYKQHGSKQAREAIAKAKGGE